MIVFMRVSSCHNTNVCWKGLTQKEQAVVNEDQVCTDMRLYSQEDSVFTETTKCKNFEQIDTNKLRLFVNINNWLFLEF